MKKILIMLFAFALVLTAFHGCKRAAAAVEKAEFIIWNGTEPETLDSCSIRAANSAASIGPWAGTWRHSLRLRNQVHCRLASRRVFLPTNSTVSASPRSPRSCAITSQ